ncbi:MAG: DUF4142 domain-containing protein [Bdellovibrionales bacterium]|nr:DUF4142 domain-containing protein [Bdellovibrionales bacterium]
MFISSFLALAFTYISGAQTVQSSPQTLDDNQIIGVLQVIDRGEVESATHALRKANHTSVKELAKHIRDDHRALEGQSTNEMQLRPAPSPIAESLQKDARKRLTALKRSSNKDFDRAYIQDQIGTHTATLQMIDQQLLPQAKKEVVREHLKTARAKIEGHLATAQRAAIDI